MPRNSRYIIILVSTMMLTYISSCTKNDVQFGEALGETFTHVSQIDTVAIDMSTVIVDSFATSNDSSFLFGRYKDPFLGLISAKPFFQLSRPLDLTLPADAVYDSLCLIVKLDNYYYGDTAKRVTVVVRELTEPINYSYGGRLYNNSAVHENPVPLGSKAVSISPARDSILVRLDDTKGKEIFDKMLQGAVEFQDAGQFANFFKGLSLSYDGNDSSAILGIKANAGNIKMRLYYHSTNPYPSYAYKDFAYDNTLINFNQILTDRSATKLASITSGVISSAQTDNLAYSQPATGLLLKMTFPSLRNILQIDTTIRLLKATLVLKASPGTYDPFKLKLPTSLFLVKTDGTNLIGSTLSNALGNIVYAIPSVDYIYNTPASYSLDVTSYINTQLTTSGSQNNGLYLLQTYPGDLSIADRVVISDSQKTADLRSKLILSVLTIKN